MTIQDMIYDIVELWGSLTIGYGMFTVGLCRSDEAEQLFNEERRIRKEKTDFRHNRRAVSQRSGLIKDYGFDLQIETKLLGMELFN